MEVIVQEFEIAKLKERGYALRFVEGVEREAFELRTAVERVGCLTLLTAELLGEEFGVEAEVIDPAELFPGQRVLYWGEYSGRDRYAELEVVRVP